MAEHPTFDFGDGFEPVEVEDDSGTGFEAEFTNPQLPLPDGRPHKHFIDADLILEASASANLRATKSPTDFLNGISLVEDGRLREAIEVLVTEEPTPQFYDALRAGLDARESKKQRARIEKAEEVGLDILDPHVVRDNDNIATSKNYAELKIKKAQRSRRLRNLPRHVARRFR